MNEEAQKVLNTILAKDVEELTTHDIAFLKARLQYVGKKSRAKFIDVLNAETPKKEEEEESEDESNDSQHPATNPDDDGEIE